MTQEEHESFEAAMTQVCWPYGPTSFALTLAPKLKVPNLHPNLTSNRTLTLLSTVLQPHPKALARERTLVLPLTITGLSQVYRFAALRGTGGKRKRSAGEGQE